MIFEFTLKTPEHGLVDITEEVRASVNESGVNEGICVVFSPHSTSAISICANDTLSREFQENDSPDGDSLLTPSGASETIIISGGKLLIGKAQTVCFCELNGPRERKFYVKIMGG